MIGIGLILGSIVFIIGMIIPFSKRLSRTIIKVFNIKEEKCRYDSDILSDIYRHGADGFRNVEQKEFGSLIFELFFHSLIVIAASLLTLLIWPVILIFGLFILFVVKRSKSNK